MRIISRLTDRATINRILSHTGKPTTPPPIASARAPPSGVSDLDQTPAYDFAAAEPVPEFDSDQTVPF